MSTSVAPAARGVVSAAIPRRAWVMLAMATIGFAVNLWAWARSIFYFHPDVDLITRAPIGFQIHVMLAWVLFAAWPFTRLVHLFSAPLGYLTRPYIVYRSRAAAVTRPTRRGWEPVVAPTTSRRGTRSRSR